MRQQNQQLDAEWERSQGQMYQFFATVLLNRPDQELLEGLLSQQAVESLQMVFPGHPAIARLAHLAEEYRQGRREAEEFLLDYEALFRVPGDTFSHPYQSAYLMANDHHKHGSRPSLDPCITRLVSEAYQRQGLAPGKNFDEPPDHIGAQFDLMSWLCRLTADALDKGDIQEALRLHAEKNSFWADHLLGWGSECLSNVENQANTDLYRCLAELARLFLNSEPDQ